MSKLKITITIEKEVVQALDRWSIQTSKNRSRLIEEAVRWWQEHQLKEELINGYRAMAQEDLETAEANLPSGVEALE